MSDISQLKTHFKIRNIAGLELLVCEPLELAGFVHAFTGRRGGVSPLPADGLNLGNFSQDSRENIQENRRRLKSALGIKSWPLATLRQIHSADIFELPTRELNESEPQEGDALLTDLQEIAIGVQTADCLPVLLADRRSGAVAAVHAGWRGTLAGIVSSVVGRMEQRFNTRPDDIIAVLGPAIGSCCFEIGAEVVTLFQNSFVETDQFVSRRQANGKANFNLNLANRIQLRQAGVADNSVFDSDICTVCHNDRFFSYRFELGAEKPVGRQMALIGLGLPSWIERSSHDEK